MQTRRLDFARRSAASRLQACLWDELDAVSQAYWELESLAGKEPKRDFKDNDRDAVKNVPNLLREAKG